MVHQHFKLVDTMTVAENIHLGWDGDAARAITPQGPRDAHGGC